MTVVSDSEDFPVFAIGGFTFKGELAVDDEFLVNLAIGEVYRKLDTQENYRFGFNASLDDQTSQILCSSPENNPPAV